MNKTTIFCIDTILVFSLFGKKIQVLFWQFKSFFCSILSEFYTFFLRTIKALFKGFYNTKLTTLLVPIDSIQQVEQVAFFAEAVWRHPSLAIAPVVETLRDRSQTAPLGGWKNDDQQIVETR